jgi:hypothetical protein
VGYMAYGILYGILMELVLVSMSVCTPPLAKLVASRLPSKLIHAHLFFHFVLTASVVLLPFQGEWWLNLFQYLRRNEEPLVRRIIPRLCYHRSCARNLAKNKPISNKTPSNAHFYLVQGRRVRGSQVHPERVGTCFRIATSLASIRPDEAAEDLERFHFVISRRTAPCDCKEIPFHCALS